MKLVFYSGGDAEENQILDEACLKLTHHQDPLMTFIPSDSIDGEHEFRYFVQRFQQFGVKRFLYFPIDVPQDNVFFKEVLTSEFIFLGGGNTYYFMKYLRASGLFKELKNFVKRGGVLAGESAGAIMMTPTLAAAGYPSFDCDENGEGMVNLKAMSLVTFEFFPHYRNSERYERELIKQSRKVSYPIYACGDGGGIIKETGKMSFIGKAWCFFRGKKINVMSRQDKWAGSR